MIVCHCNVITDHEVREAARKLKEQKGGGVPTPGAVFSHLGKRPKCGGCFPTIIELVYAEHESDSADTANS
ncbi:(2Fe-2S)-binding protein [Rhodobacteraceae bacterium RKSG542]|uniref:(2Fe-2S)-binding protein n=1 Tax=Pseudovibrio flavus TaxID=2529854 RepID=UPI0012BBAD95|nr:(2Fe-2S)-binding protein [Pseudovibrio flavus]